MPFNRGEAVPAFLFSSCFTTLNLGLKAWHSKSDISWTARFKSHKIDSSNSRSLHKPHFLWNPDESDFAHSPHFAGSSYSDDNFFTYRVCLYNNKIQFLNCCPCNAARSIKKHCSISCFGNWQDVTLIFTLLDLLSMSVPDSDFSHFYGLIQASYLSWQKMTKPLVWYLKKKYLIHYM